MKPLYMAPMILLEAPSLTKKVPITEVMMQAPPMTRGYSIILPDSSASPAKKIEARTMVATMVTA